jgi:hypothetical protein
LTHRGDPALHKRCIRKVPSKVNVQEEPLKDGFKNCIRHPKLKGAATSEDGDDIQQGLQEAHRAEERKAKNQECDFVMGSE